MLNLYATANIKEDLGELGWEGVDKINLARYGGLL
jgi:hypothetical protein